MARAKHSPQPTGILRNKPSIRTRVILSVIIALHMLAVVSEPFRFFTRSSRGTSPAADPARDALAPYVEFAYLNHGYFFFAPEPGPSHLIECRLQRESGKQARLRFPDRNAQWPRLLYHRHFMLAENLHQLWVPPIENELVTKDDPLLKDWRSERSRFEAIRDSMARHLIDRYEATSVEIERIEHRLPSSDEVLLRGMRLSDPSLYITLSDVAIEVPPPLPPNSPVENPGRTEAVSGNQTSAEPAEKSQP